MSDLNIAVVGIGNWGQNLVRVFNQLENLYIGCDTNIKKVQKLKKIYHNVKFTTSFDEVLEDKNVDGVVIASPAVTHYELAKKALLDGKPVYIEKPMTVNSKEAEELIQIADRKGLPLMIGHLLKYHPAIRKIKELIDNNDLGNVYYIYSQRVNLGTIREDENALWSFAPHDISVALYLLGDRVESVSARGGCYLNEHIEDVVFLNIQFEDKKMANIQVSWLDPYKERKLTIVGSKKMVEFDDMEHAEKIRIYDKGVNKALNYESYGEYLSLRFGDIYIPKIDTVEPLKLECQHFLECIKNNITPYTDGKEGMKVVRILEKAQESLKNHGMPVRV